VRLCSGESRPECLDSVPRVASIDDSVALRLETLAVNGDWKQTESQFLLLKNSVKGDRLAVPEDDDAQLSLAPLL
jgi:hypothetical protein